MMENLYVYGGIEVLASEYPYVCVIGIQDTRYNEEIDWLGEGSGILTEEGFVATALHVIERVIAGPGRYKLFCAFGISSTTSIRKSNIVEIDISGVRTYPDADVAIFPLELSYIDGIAIATTSEIVLASELIVVGFGSNSILGNREYGTKRKALNDILVINNVAGNGLDLNQLLTDYDFDPTNEILALGRKGNACSGDSGAPAIVWVQGQWKLAGIAIKKAIPHNQTRGVFICSPEVPTRFSRIDLLNL